MSITEFMEKNYSTSVEKIKNTKSNIEKRILLTELLGNVIHSGVKYTIRGIKRVVGVSRRLIRSILASITDSSNNISNAFATETRGRKKVEVKNTKLVNQIKEICENSEHVDKSLKDDITYIDFTAKYVREKLVSEYGYNETECPCENTIRRIFKEDLGYKLTKIIEDQVIKKIPETDAIFENVNKKKQEVKDLGDTAVAKSIDDKATKSIDNISEKGKTWEEKHTKDHQQDCKCKVKPFGILDMNSNNTTVFCTEYSSTAEFKVECLKESIKQDMVENLNLKKVYLFLDNGPENSSRRTLWLYCLINLAIDLNIIIELVYYPPYHSKYNPIEHFWGVLQRGWCRLVIDDFEKLIGSINATQWHEVNSKGILVEKEYEKGKKVNKTELEKLIQEHVTYPTKGLEKWSLIIHP